MADNRKRNFETIVYPESCPSDWLDIITALKVPCFVSPLHDSDINANGEPKKPHYHVMLMFEGKQNPDTVKEMCVSFGGVGMEIVRTVRGSARYLCHMDNPDKAQYSISDVKSFAGADYYSIISLASDRYYCISEMISFVKEERILFFSDLLEYAASNREDWFKLLCDNSAYIMKEYIWSYNRAISGSNTEVNDDEYTCSL